MAFDTSSTGSITATSGAVQIALEGNQGAAAVISGTWSATLLADASADGGATWYQVDFFNPLFGVESVIANTTANGTYVFTHVGGMSHVRVRANPFTSGTVNVYLRSSFAPIWFTDSVPDNSASPKHVAPAGVHDGANTWYQRTPNKFTVVSSIAAGTSESTIWTPAAGKKFRFMGFNLTSASSAILSFRDTTGSVGTAVIFEAMQNGTTPIGPINIGNGILSASTNNFLTVSRNTTSVITDGTVWGTEE